MRSQMEQNDQLEDVIFSVDGLFGYPSQLCQLQPAPSYGYIQPQHHTPVQYGPDGGALEANQVFVAHQEGASVQQDQENPVRRGKRLKGKAKENTTCAIVRAKSTKDSHNAIERRRRHRIRDCCDVLKTMVPGLPGNADKATVLEQTVRFVQHLYCCHQFNPCQCDSYQ